jgi:disulfide bond formation protein DsbB
MADNVNETTPAQDTSVAVDESAGDSATADVDTTITPTFWNFIGYWFPHVIVLGYTGVIASAITIQFVDQELPCPLCTLQRMAMVLVAISAVWIIGQARNGTLTPSRYARSYGMMMLGALLGMLISTRQVLLHILPDDPGYGEPILGLHLYTWALVTFFIVLLYSAIMLTVIKPTFPVVPKATAATWISRIVFALFILIIATNVVLIFIEAGFNWVLPDDPERYQLLYDLGIKK